MSCTLLDPLHEEGTEKWEGSLPQGGESKYWIPGPYAQSCGPCWRSKAAL